MIPPRNVGRRHLGVTQITGTEWWIVKFLPRCIALPILARRIMKKTGLPSGIPGDLTFSAPDVGCWEIVDEQGHVKPFVPPAE